MLLYKLAAKTNRDRFAPSVVSLTSEGPILGEKIRAAGVPVQALGYPRGAAHPKLLWSMMRQIHESRPDIIQTWLYHADLLGGLAARLVTHAPVIWGIHNTELDAAKVKRSTMAVIQTNGLLSHVLPTGIVCCSGAARDAHVKLGYAAERMRTITNGVDTTEFTYVPDAREAIRKELGLAANTPLVGLAARFDPQKDHETFIRAAGLLHKIRPDVHFVLCGGDVTEQNTTLADWIQRERIAPVTHLLGLRRDMPTVTSALDAATICSVYGESFALVIGEAMACGVPSVTTDLEGPMSVVGDAGWVVPIQDPRALSDAWKEMLAISEPKRREIAACGRSRIVDNFSIEKMVRSYEALYEEIADGAGQRRPLEAVT